MIPFGYIDGIIKKVNNDGTIAVSFKSSPSINIPTSVFKYYPIIPGQDIHYRIVKKNDKLYQEIVKA